jgi:hypothetical protein
MCVNFIPGLTYYEHSVWVLELGVTVSKTTFRCLGFVGLFEWVIIIFGVKNAHGMYQRAMNLIFHDLLRVLMEIYIDDVVVNSVGFEEHKTDL